MLLRGWNTERVTHIASNPQSAKASRKLAHPRHWEQLGHDAYTVWGIFPRSGKAAYQAKIDILKLQKNLSGFGCTCATRQQPCEHTLALLFLLVESPDAIPSAPPPEFVKDWLDKPAVRARKEQERKSQAADGGINRHQRQKNYAERLQKVREGLEELDLWLHNLVRHGLADPAIKSYAFWDDKAARMVDAKAPGVAALLREMGSLILSGDQWIEEALIAIGRLNLVIEGFKHFDKLTTDQQADLRNMVGWYLRKDEVVEQQPVYDEWLVLGSFSGIVDDKLRTQRWWLKGTQTHRMALIREYAWGDAPFETYLEPGWVIEADLVFYPSGYPLRALVVHTYNEPQLGRSTSGETIQASIEAYSHAIASNPWLPEFPVLLDAVVPTRFGQEWVVREADGTALPLSPDFDYQWALLSLSGGYPLQVAGEWTGQFLMPTGAFAEGRFVNFEMVGKV